MLRITDLDDIALFDGIGEAERRCFLEQASEATLEPGEYFSREGDPQTRFYITLEGELQITRRVSGREQVMGTTPRGIIGGEIAILNNAPSLVSARAIVPSRLLVLEPAHFRALFANCPVVSARILQIATERGQNFATLVTQEQKLAALGKLSAGLAHELNNPAAAARRSASTLRAALTELHDATLALGAANLTPEQMERLHATKTQLTESEPPALSPLARSEREDEIADVLTELGIEDGYTLAPTFVAAGVDVQRVQAIADDSGASAVPVLRWLHGVLSTDALLDEMDLSTRRISDLVGAVKSYSFMDQAERKPVNIQRGLDDTVIVMGYKLRGITIERRYDPDLPKIMARGGELNQVWTNLIDNAAYALNGSGTITLITRAEPLTAMVEIADNGPGIPAAALPQIFEPFFTTKDVGEGTGLGLDTCYRIVRQHGGTIEVRSEPGLTRFIVRIPYSGGV